MLSFCVLTIILLYIHNILAESEEEVEDVHKKKRPQRKLKQLPLALLSPYWAQNMTKLTNISAKQKLFSDYAFLSCGGQFSME